MAITAASALLCLVVGISDGDTLTAKCPEAQIKVRLAEIDAPEKKQPWGNAAKKSLSSACFGIQAEILPLNKDRYGRLIAHVRCRGNDAGSMQVSSGMAWVYDQYAKDKNLYRLQTHAQSHGLGLWSEAKPIAPWLWRKRR